MSYLQNLSINHHRPHHLHSYECARPSPAMLLLVSHAAKTLFTGGQNSLPEVESNVSANKTLQMRFKLLDYAFSILVVVDGLATAGRCCSERSIQLSH